MRGRLRSPRPSQPNNNYDFFRGPCKIEICSLCSNTWTVLDVQLPIESGGYISFDLFFNGRMHWNTYEECILSLDISTEALHKFGLPKADRTSTDESTGDGLNLSVIHDSLVLILYPYKYPYRLMSSLLTCRS